MPVEIKWAIGFMILLFFLIYQQNHLNPAPTPIYKLLHTSDARADQFLLNEATGDVWQLVGNPSGVASWQLMRKDRMAATSDLEKLYDSAPIGENNSRQ